MIPLNYHHLFYFYTIAKEGSISRACDVLRLAQPTLSTQLKQFEHQVKKVLFERNKNRLVLTEHGRAVYDYAQRIFGLTRELEGMLKGSVIQTQKTIDIGVQVGTPKAFCHAVLSHILKGNATANVRLKEAHLDQLLFDLENLNLDIVMTDSPVTSPDAPNCKSIPIGNVPLEFVAAPSLARKFQKWPLKDKAIPIILPSDPSPVYHEVKNWMSTHLVRPKIVAEVQDVEIARRLAMSGFGIAPINAYTVSVSLPKGALVKMKWKIREPIYEKIHLVVRERHLPNPLADNLIRSFRIKVP